MRLNMCHSATLPLLPSQKCVYRPNCTENDLPNVYADEIALKMTTSADSNSFLCKGSIYI